MLLRSFLGTLLFVFYTLPIGLVADRLSAAPSAEAQTVKVDSIARTSPPTQDERAALDVPIRRFSRVDARLFRGGQPDEAGFAHLRQLGIRTVISLRKDPQDERQLVESLGMRFVNIPLTFRPFGLGDEVPDDAIERFFDVVDDPASGTVFVHCWRGADRTGTLVALYRIARQGWDVDRAYDEARDTGMHWWFFPIKGTMARFARTLVPAVAAQ